MSDLSMTEKIKKSIAELYNDIPEIKGVAVATLDGLPLVTDIKGDLTGERVSALVATAVSLGKRIMPSLNLGDVTEMSLSSQESKLFLYLIGNSSALCIIAPREINLGMMMLKAGIIARKLVTIIEGA